MSQQKSRIGVVVAPLILSATSFLYAGIFMLDEGERLGEQIANAAKQMGHAFERDDDCLYA